MLWLFYLCKQKSWEAYGSVKWRGYLQSRLINRFEPKVFSQFELRPNSSPGCKISCKPVGYLVCWCMLSAKKERHEKNADKTFQHISHVLPKSSWPCQNKGGDRKTVIHIQNQQIDRDEASPGFDKNLKYPWIDFDKFMKLAKLSYFFQPSEKSLPLMFSKIFWYTFACGRHGTHPLCPAGWIPKDWTCIKLWNPIIWFGYIVVVNPLFVKQNHFPKCHVREDAVLEDLNLFGWATFTLGNLTLTVWYWKWSHLVWWFIYLSKNIKQLHYQRVCHPYPVYILING